MAKLFDGECVNSECPQANVKVETWGAGVDNSTHRIIGSECDHCRERLQHVLAPLRIIDKSGSKHCKDGEHGEEVFFECSSPSNSPHPKPGDTIIVPVSAKTSDGKIIKGPAICTVTRVEDKNSN